ncbi:RsmE family RNA methyltransferase [Flavisolibacter ginsenosidimutans]|uniref:Ribosomal RNA small subunit methyltransferase E n=1 Tax=Flavisolibacter ginsenosidimutans TaxID=661481 RepID=A0A5B8UNT8_9BACT|nr:RsmE family RNA methyltransferase [Flavisolibacter ginsenosidimutans]QEC58116.1 16S rRNA (uracil(1498)-N(3))-methyltransferase [Flavisolibacter ginsenosidimutans]
MALSFFFVESLRDEIIQLDEDTSKHMIGVLRMAKGEEVLLTDGKGKKARAEIIDDNRKRCAVQVQSIETEEESRPNVSIAISIIKNSSRFEWFLEKATEIGVNEIVPLLCERTEKEKFRYDRMQGILSSAMLQSQQTWLPVLHQPTAFNEAVKSSSQEQKFIAHCLPEKKQQLSSVIPHPSSLILIGPEGDFTEKEISLALENNFLPVALGGTRLRTETAGIVAATLLKILGKTQ